MPTTSAATPAIPSVMTAMDVAQLMKISPKTVYKLKDCDGLPAHRFGGSVRFYLHEVLEWMDSQTTVQMERKSS